MVKCKRAEFFTPAHRCAMFCIPAHMRTWRAWLLLSLIYEFICLCALPPTADVEGLVNPLLLY
jgi:hypothetical protein